MISLVGTSLRGVDSHGVELLPHYLRALDRGRINPRPEYRFRVRATAAATTSWTLDHTFGHAAGAEAMARAIGLARRTRCRCSCCLRVHTPLGRRGTSRFLPDLRRIYSSPQLHTCRLSPAQPQRSSPIFSARILFCFAAPCEGGGASLPGHGHQPRDVEQDPSSTETRKKTSSWLGVRWPGATDHSWFPGVLLAPIGGYKGFGLAMMIEVLCSLLSGMPFGPDVPMYTTPLEERRRLLRSLLHGAQHLGL